jgi:hypothetical protein
MIQGELTQTLSEKEREQFNLEIMTILEKSSTAEIEMALHQIKLKRNVYIPKHKDLK